MALLDAKECFKFSLDRVQKNRIKWKEKRWEIKKNRITRKEHSWETKKVEKLGWAMEELHGRAYLLDSFHNGPNLAAKTHLFGEIRQ